MIIIALADIFTLFIFFVCLVIAGKMVFDSWRNQSNCKHDEGVNETSACDAVCKECGKNLGFIGTWRDKHK